MAERGFTPITVHSLLKDVQLSAGDTGTSPAVDLRYAAQRGKFALNPIVALGTSGTAGTTVFSYLCAPSLNGTYVAPSAAVAIGTMGTALGGNVIDFEPVMAPFMKIVATQSGAGSAGNASKITVNLFVQ